MKNFLSLRWCSPVDQALLPAKENGSNRNAYADLMLPGTSPASIILLMIAYPGAIFKNEMP